jgi:hypothetical protein
MNLVGVFSNSLYIEKYGGGIYVDIKNPASPLVGGYSTISVSRGYPVLCD